MPKNSSDPDSEESRPIRVVLQQAALPAYRVPVFETLSRRKNIDLTLYYGHSLGKKVDPESLQFRACHHPTREFGFGRFVFRWHQPQWQNATRARCDVLMLSWNMHYMSLVPALLRAKAVGMPTVLWGHGYSKRETAWREWTRSRVGKLATALLFYNHTGAEQYRRENGETGDPGRIFVALNSLDQRPIAEAKQQWTHQPERMKAFRREHGLRGPVILYVSRLLQANRIDLLIEAGSRLLENHADLKIVIIGDGPDEARLKQRVSELGISPAVLFPGAIYDEMKIAPWFLASDAFCYPANIGLSLLHAFGYGTPAVTSDNLKAQNPEIEALQDGVNGLLYEDDNLASLVEKLEELLNSQEKRLAMGVEAQRAVQSQFSLSNMVDGMEAAIRYSVFALKKMQLHKRSDELECRIDKTLNERNKV